MHLHIHRKGNRYTYDVKYVISRNNEIQSIPLPKEVINAVDQVHLSDYFSDIVSAENVIEGKSRPAIFLKAAFRAADLAVKRFDELDIHKINK